ncbi:unnamed protein product [Pleuronectes platessa]|uniref:Uncharacterized protein n=1 Tax=Pleuronectes platessa TaxID=8262 RepID=A0A9N7UJE2_PLEPL|nr:unnamed protein product [Pleuronectes platessa]
MSAPVLLSTRPFFPLASVMIIMMTLMMTLMSLHMYQDFLYFSTLLSLRSQSCFSNDPSRGFLPAFCSSSCVLKQVEDAGTSRTERGSESLLDVIFTPHTLLYLQADSPEAAANHSPPLSAFSFLCCTIKLKGLVSPAS